MKKKKSTRRKGQMKLFNLVVDKWYCRPQSFTVKGKIANENDFGEQFDRDEGNAESYCCGDMHFTPKPATDVILKKYSLTIDEYNEICDALEDKLSFGYCGLCR